MPRFTERRIAEAFARIEDELLASMMRNLERHRVEQVREGREWERWQLVQIRELERYTREHLRRQGPRFDELNRAIDAVIRDAYDLGLSAFERLRLRLARMGLRAVQGVRSLLGIPTERLDALVEATHVDMMRAEHAVLRRSRDIYRQVIFDAQAYATSGAATYEQAIDMATRDFLARGINGITYRDGSRHGIREYAQMAVRTAVKRAALVAEGRQRQEWGVHTVFVNRRVDACPECMEWVGEVLVDDVYSGGTAEEAARDGYALLSQAMEAGLFHPNCRDTIATYYPGITRLPPKPTEEEIEAARRRESLEGDLTGARARERAYGRVADLSLGDDARDKAREREDAARSDAERAEGELAANVALSRIEAMPPLYGPRSRMGRLYPDRVRNPLYEEAASEPEAFQPGGPDTITDQDGNVRTGRYETVSVSRIRSSQGWVNRAGLRGEVEGAGRDASTAVPIVTRGEGDELWVVDGNHRLAAARLMGAKRVRVFVTGA